MPAALAIVLVVAYIQVAMVNTEIEELLAAFDLLEGSIVAAPAPSGQSNFVSSYPNEAIHCHNCFRVVDSNSYYSLIILN
jgi:hypothetical protein